MNDQEKFVGSDIERPVNWNFYFWLMTALLVALRLFLTFYLDLTPDEAYYWQLSNYPDFSYYDHPPMVAWLIAISRKLFGEGQFHVRVLSIVSSTLVSWLLFLIGRDFLHSGKTGFVAALIVNFTPAGSALGFVTTPDTPLAAAWAFAAFSFLKAINDTRDRWWIATGVALGFGALGKYNMIFFVPGVALTILGFKRYRYLVFTRRYWLMVLLAAVGTLPIIYWNINHDWISFKFQFAHGLTPAARSLSHNIGEYLGGQLGTVGPVLFPVLWFVALAGALRFKKQDDEIRFFLVWLALPSMLFFTWTGLRSKVEANWPQVAYLSTMLLVAEWLVTSENFRKRACWVIGPSAILASVAILQSITLWLPVPPKSDVTLRMHGWRQMGEIIRQLDAETAGKCYVVAQGGTLGTLVSFYGQISGDRVAELYSSGNYRVWWAGRHLEPGADVIYVDENRHSEADTHAQKFAEHIKRSHDIIVAGKKIRTLNVTLMKNLQTKFDFIHPKDRKE